MSTQNRTFIDGTDVCPVCQAKMVRFTYKKNAVSNLASKNDWTAMQRVTTWNEKTYGGGHGYMCQSCYKKRQIRFWAIFSLVWAAIIASVAVGAALRLLPLLIGGIGAAVVLFAFAYSKSGKKLYDIEGAMSRYAKSAQEFASRLVAEHPEQFGKNDHVYVERG
jgi:hypothetical protein